MAAQFRSSARRSRWRVVVKGHTGVRGDVEENLRLSQERADAEHARDFNLTHPHSFQDLRPEEHNGPARH
ncbi:MAG: hypothetical protein AB1634_17765 [Thermodesulfobacteriota bacterium]